MQHIGSKEFEMFKKKDKNMTEEKKVTTLKVITLEDYLHDKPMEYVIKILKSHYDLDDIKYSYDSIGYSIIYTVIKDSVEMKIEFKTDVYYSLSFNRISKIIDVCDRVVAEVHRLAILDRDLAKLGYKKGKK